MGLRMGARSWWHQKKQWVFHEHAHAGMHVHSHECALVPFSIGLVLSEPTCRVTHFSK